MARAAVQLLMVLSLALGSPAAACCQLGVLLGAGTSISVSDSPECSCCRESQGPTDAPARGPGPHRCTCSGGHDLLAGSAAAKADAPALVGLIAQPADEAWRGVGGHAMVLPQSGAPPGHTLLSLRALLTI